MKFKLIVIIALLFMTTAAYANDFTFDTRIGAYSINSVLQSYRNTRIGYDLKALLPSASVRVEYAVVNGVGFTGTSNNYRLGLQGVYELKLMEELNVSPFVAIGLSNSDNGNNIISCDAGLDAAYKLTDMFSIPVGGEIVIYSDSSIIEYYGGLRVAVLEWLSVDGLYSGLVSSSTHYAGFAGKINIKF